MWSLSSKEFPVRPVRITGFTHLPPEICHLNLSRVKIVYLGAEDNPKDSVTEQFKGMVCGCKSNVPQPVAIFSTLLTLHCIFHDDPSMTVALLAV